MTPSFRMAVRVDIPVQCGPERPVDKSGRLMIDANCKVCKGDGWVCENHPDVPWNGGTQQCCGGAGMPCECNPAGDWPPGSTIVWDRERGYLA